MSENDLSVARPTSSAGRLSASEPVTDKEHVEKGMMSALPETDIGH